MPSILFQSVNFNYDQLFADVFDDVSFSLDTAWRTAVIGRNGRGKTTLLRLTSGAVQPDSVHIETGIAASYFPYPVVEIKQSVSTVIKDAVAPFRQWQNEMDLLLKSPNDENLEKYGSLAIKFDELGGYEIDALVERQVTKIGLGQEILGREFATLSGGEQTRALVVALFLRKDSFPLIDEPTNHLDSDGQRALAEYLAGQDSGYVVVSHDRYFLDECCDHVLAINPGGITVTNGNYSTCKQQSDYQQQQERRRDENLKQEIKQLKRAASDRRSFAGKKESEKKGASDKGFVGARGARHMKRAISIEQRIEKNILEKSSLLRNQEKERSLKLQSSGPGNHTVLNINNLTITFEDKTIISNFSLNMKSGQRIAIVGPNGCGKTTLLNAICGDLQPGNGSIAVPGYVRINCSYQTPVWHKGYLLQQLQSHNLEQTRFRQILGEFDVSGDIFDRPLESFSQGQLKKVDLCRTLVTPSELLIWDEPMNCIDILSREGVQIAFLKYEPTLLFVEHDRYFVDQVATDVVNLAGN